MTDYLQHNRIRLALHQLKAGGGHPLLLLHGLGERSPERLPADYASWRGPVHALDFTGHGMSGLPKGGGYTCEYLMADADIALARLGCATVAGRGLGAYVALLIAGARPKQVRGAILLDGPGLAGGASHAGPAIPAVDASQPAPPDPYAIAELSVDARPPRYALGYALLAAQQSGLAHPLSVCAFERPEWLGALMEALSLQRTELDYALREYQTPLWNGVAVGT